MPYTYDLDGRMTTAAGRTFVWAQPDRLQSTTEGAITTTYTYDGDGLRLQAATGSQASKKTNYDWDPLAGAVPELVAERTGNGSLVRRYLNGLATISLTAGNKTAYLHYDGLGSVVNLTSATGVTWWTYSYLPFGGVRTETKLSNQAPDNVLRFAGEYLDPTGLYHLRARQYDPGTGRFIATDPVAAPPADPYIAAYLYAGNNPIRRTDPNGQCPLVFVAAAIGGLLGSVLPGPGTLAGAEAGAASVGFIFCAAETTVELGAIANAVRDLKLGDPKPLPPYQPLIKEPFQPPSVLRFAPDTGDLEPSGGGPSASGGGNTSLRRLLALLGITGLAVGNGLFGEEGESAPDVMQPPSK